MKRLLVLFLLLASPVFAINFGTHTANVISSSTVCSGATANGVMFIAPSGSTIVCGDADLTYVDSTGVLQLGDATALAGVFRVSDGSTTLSEIVLDGNGPNEISAAGGQFLVGSTDGDIHTKYITENNADPAEAGFLRMGNNSSLAWEKAVAGTDWTLGVNASDVLATNAPFSSSVSATAPFFSSSAADPADAGVLRLGSGDAIKWEHTTESSISDTAGVTTIDSGANSVLFGSADSVGFGDGTATAPSMAFTSDADGSGTGFHRWAANKIGVDFNGSQGLSFESAGILSLSNGNGFKQVSGNTTAQPGTADYTVYSGAGIIAANLIKALTESSATNVVQVSVASTKTVGGTITYTVEAKDAVPKYQARSGSVHFQIINNAGTEVCVVSGYDGTAGPSETKDGSSIAEDTGGSTLTYTWATDTSPTNACMFTLNAVSSLTQTALNISYHLTINAMGVAVTITPQ